MIGRINARLAFVTLSLRQIPGLNCIAELSYCSTAVRLLSGVLGIVGGIGIVILPIGLAYGRWMRLPRRRLDAFRSTCISRIISILCAKQIEPSACCGAYSISFCRDTPAGRFACRSCGGVDPPPAKRGRSNPATD